MKALKIRLRGYFFTSSSYDKSNNSGSYVVDNIINVDASHLPNENNSDVIFGVPITSINDIDVLTERFEAGEYEEVMMRMTVDEQKAAMDATETVWKKLLADVTGNMFNSYVGAAGASTSEPCKAKANFRSLYSDNLCNGVDFTIPRKVVERVSTRFENTVYGYFISKRVAFSVVEYYLKRNDGSKMICSMGVPLDDDLGFSKETVCIEYEGKLPRCETCKIFGHVHDQCPKYITVTPTPIVEKSNDGFQMVVNKKKNDKASSNISVKFSGQSVKSNVKYMPKASSGISKTVPSKKNQTPKASSSSRGSQNGKNGDPYAKENVTSPYDSFNIPVSNPYACLDEESEEEVENVFDEYANLLSSAKLGASSLPRVGEAA
ncbi:hypothetical protein Tco_1373663 [Tanacetum coccineum]